MKKYSHQELIEKVGEFDRFRIQVFYMQDRLSIRQIAARLKMGRSIVGLLVKSLGISRTHGEARGVKKIRVNANYGRNALLTEEQREFFRRMYRRRGFV